MPTHFFYSEHKKGIPGSFCSLRMCFIKTSKLEMSTEPRSLLDMPLPDERALALGRGSAGPQGYPDLAFPPYHPSEQAAHCREVRRGFSLLAPGLHLCQAGMDGCPDRELMIAVFSQP